MKADKKETIGVIIAISAMVIIVSVAFYLDNHKKQTNLIDTKAIIQSNVNTANNSTISDAKPDLEVISKEDKYVDKYDYAIIGEVKNNRDYVLRNVFIRINLYDKDNKLLGDCVDRIDVLDANGIWKFKAPILNQYREGFKSYKVVELTGYK